MLATHHASPEVPCHVKQRLRQHSILKCCVFSVLLLLLLLLQEAAA
jgi:hypothetical protein